MAHLIDVPALETAYRRIRKDAAVGVDGVTKEDYGRALETNLQDLHERLKSKRYRHQPIRRVHIPKDGGKTRRPIEAVMPASPDGYAWRSRTSWSRAPCVTCWKRSTNRTLVEQHLFCNSVVMG